ncbi:hypothetical protein H9P43_004059 [Blastocladiella emersonii ATCC 22665]|nr:hypothetical protein H9P43_004059 [Blastocladiella emersonii ATCC 22665]
MLASTPAPTGPAPPPYQAPPADGYPYLSVVAADESAVEPDALLQLDRGVPKLAKLADWALPSMQASLRPIVANAVTDPAKPADLARLAAEKAIVAVHFPGMRLYFGNVGGQKLFGNMKPFPNQAWTLSELEGKPGVFALVSNSKPEFAFGFKDGKLAMVPVAEPAALVGVTVKNYLPPAPKVDVKAAPAPAPAAAAPAGGAPVAAAPRVVPVQQAQGQPQQARPAGVPAQGQPQQRPPQQQQQQPMPAKKPAPMVPITADDTRAAVKSDKTSSALDDFRKKGNHGIELTVPAAIQFKDRESYILAEAAEKPSGTDILVGKTDLLREGAKIAFFEFLALVKDPEDNEKMTLKHLDGKQARDQFVVILNSRTQELISAHSNGTFFTTDDINSEEVLWQLTKDPASQLAVSLIHVKSKKRLVIEKTKTGRLARNAPLAARLTGDISHPADENSVFTLCPERQAVVDLQHQARGRQTFKERLRENASIVSPFAMAASATVGVVTASISLMKGSGAAAGAAAAAGGSGAAGAGAAGAGAAGAAGAGTSTSRQQVDEENQDKSGNNDNGNQSRNRDDDDEEEDGGRRGGNNSRDRDDDDDEDDSGRRGHSSRDADADADEEWDDERPSASGAGSSSANRFDDDDDEEDVGTTHRAKTVDDDDEDEDDGVQAKGGMIDADDDDEDNDADAADEGDYEDDAEDDFE